MSEMISQVEKNKIWKNIFEKYTANFKITEASGDKFRNLQSADASAIFKEGGEFSDAVRDIITNALNSEKLYLVLNEMRKEYNSNIIKTIELEERKKGNNDNLEIQQKSAMLNTNSPAQFFADLVESYLKANPLYYDTKTKIMWSWDYNNFIWEMKEDADILRVFREKYGALEWVIPSIRQKIVDTLKVFASIKPKDAPVNLIQFKDLIYDINTGQSFKASPDYFFTNPIPHEIGSAEDTPIIDKLFVEWIGVKNKDALYEVLAYSMYRAYPIQRVFVLHGIGANGKGTFLRMMQRFLGIENVVATDYERVADPMQRFERSKLHNKLICQLGELENSMFSGSSILKSLSSGTDLISAEFKGKNPYDFLNYAKIIIATNAIPITPDKTDGFYRRFNIIDFPNQFDDNKDILSTIPEHEYNNLALKCIRILKELLSKGQFLNDGSIEDRRVKYESLSNPIKPFIENEYIIDVNGSVAKSDFKEAFRIYLRDNHLKTMNDREITQALKFCGFGERLKREGNKVFRIYEGFRNRIQEDDDKEESITDRPQQKTNRYADAIVTDVTDVTPLPTQIHAHSVGVESAVTSVTTVTKGDAYRSENFTGLSVSEKGKNNANKHRLTNSEFLELLDGISGMYENSGEMKNNGSSVPIEYAWQILKKKAISSEQEFNRLFDEAKRRGDIFMPDNLHYKTM